jgi:hypothetical protein
VAFREQSFAAGIDPPNLAAQSSLRDLMLAGRAADAERQARPVGRVAEQRFGRTTARRPYALFGGRPSGIGCRPAGAM